MSAAQKKKEIRFKEIRNAKALRDYFVHERFEAGIALKGTEVKSIRAGRAHINEAFGRLDKGELWLFNAHIAEYSFGNINNHSARRNRKLLLHKHQIRKIIQAMQMEGYTLIPLRMYFKEAIVKVEIALCTGKQLHDKRQDLRKRAADMEIRRAMRMRR